MSMLQQVFHKSAMIQTPFMKESVLEQFKHKETFEAMSFSDKMLGTLYTIMLGMFVTFVALVLIMYLTKLMSYIILSLEKKKQPVKPAVVQQPVAQPSAPAQVVSSEEDEELVAVITAAIAASLNTSMHNIVVTNITRVADSTPAWGKVGRNEVMASRM